jgi:acetylornithine/succinyldiaminopimelate/putrescine aminotransferase
MAKVRQNFESRRETSEAYARHVSPGKVALYRAYGFDIVMGAREGVYFDDAFSDRRLINCHCNGGVFNLGHRHPRVVRAVREALDSLDIGNHHLISGYRARLAQRLSATTDHHLKGVVFGVSGGEAVDLALKVIRGVTGRQKIVSAVGGYHGHTGLALATGDPRYRNLFGPNLPGFIQVPFNDLEALNREVDDQTAAVLLEPIPATLGMPLPEEGYLEGVRRLCTERGARLMVDEVQTGLGRTGRLWCYQHHDIRPDCLITGKGLSGGIYPITATLMTRELHALFDDHPFIHISTFGGAEPGCAAALEVLDIIEAPGFLDRVAAVGERIGEAFRTLPFDLRRRGLMMGLKFGGEGAAMAMTKVFYDAGVFCVYANNDTSVLQFLPPLIIGDEELEELIRRVKGVFA